MLQVFTFILLIVTKKKANSYAMDVHDATGNDKINNYNDNDNDNGNGNRIDIHLF